MRKAFVFALIITSFDGRGALADEYAKSSHTTPKQNIQNSSLVGVIQRVRAGSIRGTLLMQVAADHRPAVEILISLKDTRLERMANGKKVPAAKVNLAPGAKVEVAGAQIIRVQHFLKTWITVWAVSSRAESGRSPFRSTVSVLVLQESQKSKKTIT